MVYKAEVSTNTTYKEHYGASDSGGGGVCGSNLETIIIRNRNLSETHLILMTWNYPNNFKR